MRIISLKIKPDILKKIDMILEPNNFSTRTEFIREAIRDKICMIERESLIRNLSKKEKISMRNLKKLLEEVNKKER